jgi:hypothetical protein
MYVYSWIHHTLKDYSFMYKKFLMMHRLRLCENLCFSHKLLDNHTNFQYPTFFLRISHDHMSCSFGFAFLTIPDFCLFPFRKYCWMWNRIKKKLNRKRSSLGEVYVEILMLISMEEPDDESMNLNRARQLFNSEKNRRI